MAEPPARLQVDDCVVLVIDLQERLVQAMPHPKTLVRRAGRLVRGARALDVPVLLTEQYPKGLGRTVKEIDRLLEDADPPVEKLRFTACVEQVSKALGATGRRTVVLSGVEMHVCVLLTALDLLEAGYTVAVALDAACARRSADRDAAVRRMLVAGVVPTTAESLLLEWVGTAEGDRFKAIRDIVKGEG